MDKGLRFEIEPELLNAAIEEMRVLQERYEMEAAAFASLGEIGRGMAEKRLASAETAEKLFEFFANL